MEFDSILGSLSIEGDDLNDLCQEPTAKADDDSARFAQGEYAFSSWSSLG